MRTRPVIAILLAAPLVACTTPGSSAPVTPLATANPSVSAASSGSPSAVPTAAVASPTPSTAAHPAWSEITAESGPSAREDHTWTVDGVGEVAYLFGGRDGATVFDDLWALDLATDAWSEIVTPAGPPGRFGHEAAWVEGTGLVIVFGQAGTTFFDDVWAFDPGKVAWRQLPASGDVPRARYGSCAAIGPDGRLWISHGFTADGARFSDTRAYDLGSGEWSDVTPDGRLPVNRCLHGCWWTDDGAFTLYAGQTTGVTALGDRWRLSDGAWGQEEGAQPPERNLPARARVPGATLVFGGQGIDGGDLDDAWWLLDAGGDAVPLDAAGPMPPARAGAEMIVDGDRVLLFGGRNADGALADLWELSGAEPPRP